ncbi:MAG: hypothetical protein Tsb002_04710 [Wenzhouxiangellaceae bacterium]
MRLIESYLQQVGQHLPPAQRQDVIDELRDALHEQLQEQAETGDGNITLEHEKAVLQQMGHPLKVAGAYQQQQYLIGPGLFPYYRHTLWVLLVIVLGLQLAVALIAGASNDWTISIGQVIWHLIDVAVWVVAIVTLVFVTLDYSGEQLQWYKNWRPDRLLHNAVAPINRSDLITNLIGEGVFLLWWNDVLSFISRLPDEITTTPISLAPVWDRLFWPLNLILGALFALHLYALARGVWQRAGLYGEVVLNLATLIIIGILVTSDPLLTGVVSDNWPQGGLILERSLRSALLVIGGFTIWDIVIAGRHLLR